MGRFQRRAQRRLPNPPPLRRTMRDPGGDSNAATNVAPRRTVPYYFDRRTEAFILALPLTVRQTRLGRRAAC